MLRLTLPPVPSPALAELKDWLRITTALEDALLADALIAAIELCEAFVGDVLLDRAASEILSAAPEWQTLVARPVSAILEVTGLLAEGADVVLPPDAYAIELDADGAGRVLVLRPGAAGRVRIAYRAGLASDWATLPQPLRQGMLRHAAYLYTERGAREASVPAAIVALWRPYRRIRL